MSKGKILIVDDGRQFSRALQISLSSHGYEASCVESGEAALETLQSEIPDLVLLDLNLPGISGIETCRAIRAVSAVPVIIASVRDSEKVMEEAVAAGASGFLTKPFAIHKLLEQIQHLRGQ